MKKIFTLSIAILIVFSVFAQTPQKMSYQCVIRNASGVLVANQSVGIKISILQGTPSGTVVYSETYSPNPQTNANGLVTVEIGGGVPISGTFSAINWATGTYFLKTETDPSGGTSYTITGTSQLLSVPYALYAKTASTANYNDLSNLPSLNVSNWNTAYGWGNHAGLYRQAGWVPAWGDVTGKPSFATVATSGSYNDLTNKPLSLLPGGSSGNVQFNNAGALGGDADLFWDNTNKRLGIGISSPSYTLHVNSDILRAIHAETSYSNGAAVYAVGNSTTGTNVGVRGISTSTSGTGLWGDATATSGTTYAIRGEVESSSGFSGHFTGGKFYVQQNAGFGTTSPNATLDVNGTVQIGSSGKVFAEIREITGTTTGTGNYTSISFPSGYSISNIRILSAEINYNGTYWSTLGMSHISSSTPVGCSIQTSGIYLFHPDVAAYHSRAFRMLVMKVQ